MEETVNKCKNYTLSIESEDDISLIFPPLKKKIVNSYC